MNNKKIYHICTKAEWNAVKQLGNDYVGGTLETEGFIHCSDKNQVIRVANHIFKDKKELVLLEIDPKKTNHKIKYEDAGNGELFPHLYGPLNIEAVLREFNFNSNKDGLFKLPTNIY